MDCERCTEDISAYMDGELDAGLAQQLESHLAGCRACAQEFQGLKASAVFVESHAPELELRPQVWHNVRARISTAPAPARLEGLLDLILGRRWLAAIATVALLVTIGTWGYLRHQESQKQLSRYMAEYIQTREMQEQREHARSSQTPITVADAGNDRSESDNNPFVVVQFSPDENPFKSEDR